MEEPTYPDEIRTAIDKHSTLQHILHNDAFAAIFLLVASALAFVAANLPNEFMGQSIAVWYEKLWHMDVGLSIHHVAVDKPLHLWINDGLMAIFFFIVGLEIKRELIVGELASIRRATLPIAAALGGMICPALVFVAFNWGGDGMNGWGIPMATDIAFAVGVMGLLSNRVPSSLAVFLMALAIVDDLGAVIVIALFYTDSLHIFPLLVGLGLIGCSALYSFLGGRNSLVYLHIFALIWFTFLESGVHATIAGVLFALTIPVSARYDSPLFIRKIGKLIGMFEEAEDGVAPRLVNSRQQRIVRAIEDECINVEAPLQRIENKLHPFTAFAIMPIFAFANAGVYVDWANVGSLLLQPVTLGIAFGLIVGKQVGVMLFSFLTVKLKLAELPSGVSWKQLYALSWLAGIGFTMSLFVSKLAYGGGHGGVHAASVHDAGHGDAMLAGVEHLAEAKIAIIIASLIAGAVGGVLLYLTCKPGDGIEAEAH